jgi:hypothetical protein
LFIVLVNKVLFNMPLAKYCLTTPLLVPERKTLTEKKRKGKEPVKHSHKRKVEFKDKEQEVREHETERESSELVLQSKRLSKKTIKARGTRSAL